MFDEKTRGQKSRETVSLMNSAESCSGWAKNVSVASFIYLKNLIFYALFFISISKKDSAWFKTMF